MDALEYLKRLGPNPLTPVIKRLGFIKPDTAYEVSMDYQGLDGKPLWAVTVARETPTDDGATTVSIDTDLSEPFKTETACDEYILELIQTLDP
jgi:hypothetical protein